MAETADDEVPHSNVISVKLDEQMEDAYLDYAMSVIKGRALPDIRDGLKPVHRRILYTMSSIAPYNQPRKKSARIVGDVLGKYHPHGDTAVYDSLVRMAQPFSLRYPLIDPQGNFGSPDGDRAAAMRYTECRLTRLTSETMLADLYKDTVKFVKNYDESEDEPEVLPALLPNLLVNGSQGIAVGMMTNMPPHNLDEVCEAIEAYLKNNNITVRELLKYIKGPDFPTGGIVVKNRDFFDAYEKGRGKIIIRADLQRTSTFRKKRLGNMFQIFVKSQMIFL